MGGRSAAGQVRIYFVGIGDDMRPKRIALLEKNVRNLTDTEVLKVDEETLKRFSTENPVECLLKQHITHFVVSNHEGVPRMEKLVAYFVERGGPFDSRAQRSGRERCGAESVTESVRHSLIALLKPKHELLDEGATTPRWVSVRFVVDSLKLERWRPDPDAYDALQKIEASCTEKNHAAAHEGNALPHPRSEKQGAAASAGKRARPSSVKDEQDSGRTESGSSNSEATDENPAQKKPQRRRPAARKGRREDSSRPLKSAFEALHVSPVDGPNRGIVQLLSELESFYADQRLEQWRERAYSNAAAIVARLDFPIKSAEDLDRDELAGVGKKTKEKICEYLESGKVQKLCQLKEDPQAHAIRALCGIHGVSSQTALRLYRAGYRSLEDVRRDPSVLSDIQKIGLKYYDEFHLPIPRNEVEQIIERLKQGVLSASEGDAAEVIGCGSFRRQKALCKDVDVLIAVKSLDTSSPGPLGNLVEKLFEEGIITDHLHAGPIPMRLHRLYMGVCQLSTAHPHRRLDIKMCTKHERAFGLLDWTGSGSFIRTLKLHAKRQGFSFSGYGLTRALRVSSNQKEEKVKTGPDIHCATEEDIFTALGLEYVEPALRETPDAVKLLKPSK